MPIRVAVVEDDPRYRETLREFLRHAPGFVLDEAFPAPPSAIARARDAIRRDGRVGWDLVVMDLEMPHMSGVEATRRLKELAPDLRVVVLTVFEQPATILEAICAGADGYLLKRARAGELLAGLKQVAEGGATLTPAIAARVLDFVRANPAAGVAPATAGPTRLDLTDREQQVLRGLVEGLSYKQVADILGISLGTVRTHVVSIYRKLQVHSVAEAVTRALRDRLV